MMVVSQQQQQQQQQELDGGVLAAGPVWGTLEGTPTWGVGVKAATARCVKPHPPPGRGGHTHL